MKQKKMVEITLCDVCGGNHAYTSCLGCGKDYCTKCSEKNTISYPFALHFNGSNDGEFCHKCDESPPEKIQPLHHCYRTMRSIRDETEKFYKALKEKADQCEARIEELLEKRRNNEEH